MSFMDAIKTCFSKYFDFSGRARRSEYWWFYLFVFILSLIPFVNLLTIATIIPTISAAARRLHDTDRSAGGSSSRFPVVPSPRPAQLWNCKPSSSRVVSRLWLASSC